jgi:hypothetical protein
MIVTLDGEKLTKSFSAEDTLQSVIDSIRESHLDDRLVVGVALDGQFCTEDSLSEQLSQSIGHLNQIDLESGNPSAIAAEAFRSVAQEMHTVGQEQVNIAEQLNAGDVAAAVTRIGELVKAWHSVRQVMVQTSGLLQRDMTLIEFDEQPISEHLTALVGQLNEIKAALDAQDMVLLADLLHFEIPPLCELWTNLLNAVADELMNSPAGD